MSYLSSFEKEYLLDTLRVYREYDTANFITNANAMLMDTNQSIGKGFDTASYTDMVTRAYDSVKDVVLNKNMLNDFVTKFNKESLKNMKPMFVNMLPGADTIEFRTAYLKQYIVNIGNLINQIIQGKLSGSGINAYTSIQTIDNIKRQVVKTTISSSLNVKELVNSESESEVKVTSDFVITEIIPFVKNFTSIQGKLEEDTKSVLDIIEYTNKTISLYIETIDNIEVSDKMTDDINHMLRQYVFNAFRSIIDVISYMCYMLIHKINMVKSKVDTSTVVYGKLMNTVALPLQVTEGVIEHTSLLDTTDEALTEELITGDSGKFEEVANDIYTYELSNLLNNPLYVSNYDKRSDAEMLVNAKIMHTEYDSEVYKKVLTMYNDILRGLMTLNVTNDMMVVFDDVVKNAGFSSLLVEKYKPLYSTFDDTCVYDCKEEISPNVDSYYAILHELREFPSNIKIIAATVQKTMNAVAELYDGMENNINGSFDNSAIVEDVKKFLDAFKTQVYDLTKATASALFNRIKKMNASLRLISDKPAEEVSVKEESFINLMYEAMIDEYETITDVIFESLTEQYKIAKEMKEYGVRIILEDGDSNSGNTQNNQNAQQTNNTSNTNTDKQNNTTNATTNNTSGSAKSQKIMKAFQDWFDKIVKRIADLVENDTVKRNDEYLKANASNFQNRGYANSSNKNPIIEYEKLMPYATLKTNVNTILEKINSATPDTIKSATSEDQIRGIVFGNTISNDILNKEKSMSESITKYYKCGAKYDETKVTLKNNELKDLVLAAVTYCQEYSTQFIPSLKTSIEGMKKKIDELTPMMESTIPYLNGNVFMEEGENNNGNTNTSGDGNNGNTQTTQTTPQQSNTQNNTQQPTNNNQQNNGNKNYETFRKLVTSFCTGIMSAAYMRYNDYMGLLHSIIPDEGNNQNNNNQNNNQNNG